MDGWSGVVITLGSSSRGSTVAAVTCYRVGNADRMLASAQVVACGRFRPHVAIACDLAAPGDLRHGTRVPSRLCCHGPRSVAVWRRHHTRQRIAELDNHMLKDIGVSFAEAETEANKPFWQE